MAPACPFLTVKQFCMTYNWPSEPALRSYIFRATELGIENAFLRLGRRVLVDPKKLFDLIREIAERPETQPTSKLEEKYASLKNRHRARGGQKRVLAGFQASQNPQARA